MHKPRICNAGILLPSVTGLSAGFLYMEDFDYSTDELDHTISISELLTPMESDYDSAAELNIYNNEETKHIVPECDAKEAEVNADFAQKIKCNNEPETTEIDKDESRTYNRGEAEGICDQQTQVED